MKLKNSVKRDITNITAILILALTIILPVNNWLNSEDVIVFASTPTVPTTPTPVKNLDRRTAGSAVVGENQSIRDLIYKIFGEEDGKIAYAIAKCESGLNPSRIHKDEIEDSVGLFQINLIKGNGNGSKVHSDKVPGNTIEEKEAWLKVPENNILIAKFIKGSSGFYPWSVYKNGCYKKFL